MAISARNIIAGFLVLVAVYAAVVQYSISVVPQMQWDSKLALNEFYVRSQAGDYAQAHQTFSRKLKNNVDVESLSQQWQAFEQAHGPIKNWTSARGAIRQDKISLWPRYVEFTHTLKGEKNSTGTVSVRMVPEHGTWRIARLNIQL